MLAGVLPFVYSFLLSARAVFSVQRLCVSVELILSLTGNCPFQKQFCNLWCNPPCVLEVSCLRELVKRKKLQSVSSPGRKPVVTFSLEFDVAWLCRCLINVVLVKQSTQVRNEWIKLHFVLVIPV